MSLIASAPDTLVAELEAANRAIGIDDPFDVVAPRKTGDLDLDSLEPVPPPITGSTGQYSLIKDAILANGLPALVLVERLDEHAAVVIHARRMRRDSRGATLLEVAFMHNTRETFQSPGSLEVLALEALREEVGDIWKASCDDKELQELLQDLKTNSARLSVTCHMRHREAFACGKMGNEATQNRVVREPLELSFLQLSGRSAMLAAVLEVKERGNSKFSAGLLGEALELYQQALDGLKGCSERGSGEARAEEGKIHANRAECFLRQEKWQAAIEAAGTALEVDAHNVKACLRRAKAHKSLGNITAAVADLKSTLRADPKNQPARALLKELCPGAQSGPNRASTVTVHPLPPAAVAPAGGSLPTATTWSLGLPPAMQHEWLVDCYRMRVDDDYAWGGGNLRGLYAEATGGGGSDMITQDFLVFCKLAVSKGVVPEGWDWKAFLQTARGLLRFAFEKSDAQEKYGSENVFAVATGGRSLRYTAEAIYGSSIMSMEDSKEAIEMEETVQQQRGREEVFSDVGGVAVWIETGLAPRHVTSRASRGLGKGKSKGKGQRGNAKGGFDVSKQPCRYHQSGNCAYGSRCRFSHEVDAAHTSSVPLCRNWHSGMCSYGDRCRFRHE